LSTTHVEFTRALNILLSNMLANGERPILDYCKRSAEEQNRLFKEGKSKCDGYKKISKHQQGLAVDIYFVGLDGKLTDPKLGWEYWHNIWEGLGGRKMIEWDKMHFEG